MKPNCIAAQDEKPNTRLLSVGISSSAMETSDSEGSLSGFIEILVDSGASKHVQCNSNLLNNVQQVLKVQVYLANGSRIESNQQDLLFLQVGPERITLTNVHCILE